MQSKQMIRIAINLAGKFIEILKQEFNGKGKVTDADKQKKSSRSRKAGR